MTWCKLTFKSYDPSLCTDLGPLSTLWVRLWCPWSLSIVGEGAGQRTRLFHPFGNWLHNLLSLVDVNLFKEMDPLSVPIKTTQQNEHRVGAREDSISHGFLVSWAGNILSDSNRLLSQATSEWNIKPVTRKSFKNDYLHRATVTNIV